MSYEEMGILVLVVLISVVLIVLAVRTGKL